MTYKHTVIMITETEDHIHAELLRQEEPSRDYDVTFSDFEDGRNEALGVLFDDIKNDY